MKNDSKLRGRTRQKLQLKALCLDFFDGVFFVCGKNLHRDKDNAIGSFQKTDGRLVN